MGLTRIMFISWTYLRRVFFWEFYHSAAHACWHQNKNIKLIKVLFSQFVDHQYKRLYTVWFLIFLFIELLKCVMFWWQSIIKNNMIEMTVILIYCILCKCKQNHLIVFRPSTLHLQMCRFKHQRWSSN